MFELRGKLHTMQHIKPLPDGSRDVNMADFGTGRVMAAFITGMQNCE